MRNRQVRLDARVADEQKDFELALFMLRNLGGLLSRRSISWKRYGGSRPKSIRAPSTHMSAASAASSTHTRERMALSAVYQHGYRLERIEAARR